MKKIILVLMVLSPSLSFAGYCSSTMTKEKVLQAAISIDSVNGGGKPLTTELHSYSSKSNTWGVILSYYGIQSVWTVATSEDGCDIKAVYR